MKLSFHLLLAAASLGVAAAVNPGPKPKMVASEVTSGKGNLFDPAATDDSETVTAVNSVNIGTCAPGEPFSFPVGSMTSHGVVGVRCGIETSLGISSETREVSFTGDTQDNFFNDAVAEDAEFCGAGFIVEDGGHGGLATVTVTCPEATDIIVIVKEDNAPEEAFEATVTCTTQGGTRLELTGASAASSQGQLKGESQAARAKGGPPANAGSSPVAFENASGQGIDMRPTGTPGNSDVALVQATYVIDGNEVTRTFINQAGKCNAGGGNTSRKLKSVGVRSSAINEDGDVELDFDLGALRELLDSEEDDARFKVDARIGLSASLEDSENKDASSTDVLHEVVDMSAFLSVDEPKMIVHGGWIRRALSSKLGEKAAYTGWDVVVKEIAVSDPEDGYRVVAHMNDVHMTGVGSDKSHRRARMLEAPTEEELNISDDMLRGRKPAQDRRGLRALSAGLHKKILVHGYCSNASPFTSSHFSNAMAFQDQGTSRRKLGGSGGGNNWSNDEFARKIDAFAYKNDIEGCGIIAHSQGGLASLHLYANYWSCLDYPENPGRMIQSVGSPYLGTPLAGNAAALGEVFGAGCGTQDDLTTSGASSWLNGIPSWARSAVNYYTTSFETKWWRYDYCHLATDLFLSDPDDGTVEKSRGQLSGAYNRGHAIKQCHSSGMRDPHQAENWSRNSALNTYAQY